MTSHLRCHHPHLGPGWNSTNSRRNNDWLLCVSSIVLMQTNFRRYYFYFLPDQAQTLLYHFNVLGELWGEISTGFDNKWRWGNSLSVVGFEWNFAPEFVKNLPMIEVSLSLIGKNNIAENSFALVHETHNRLHLPTATINNSDWGEILPKNIEIDFIPPLPSLTSRIDVKFTTDRRKRLLKRACL